MDYLEFEKRANLLRNSKIDSKKFTITFCGVFSSGKSTIINNLLDYDGFKLPVGVSPVTKLVTQIEYGPSLNIYYISGGQKFNLSKKEFVDCVQDKIKLPDDCSKIYITIPSKFLKNNVVLIDTPGFLDEMGGKLEQISREAVLEADIAVLCTNAIQFGSLFEKDYLEELEESVKNFCVIVNRMDCLNNDEDVDDVKANAFRLAKKKGGEILPKINNGNLFFTSADGEHKNIFEFAEYLSYVLSDNYVKDILKKSSHNSIIAYKTKVLSMDIDLKIAELCEELSGIIAKHNRAKNIIDSDVNFSQLELDKEKEDLLTQLESMFISKSDSIYSKMNQIERDGQWYNFKETIDKMIPEIFLSISRWLDDKIKNSIVLKKLLYTQCNAPIPNFTSHFNTILEKFSLSEPKGKRILMRKTFLSRAWETIDNFRNGINMIDDGYGYEYSGYANVGIDEVKNGLIPKLKKRAISLIEKFYEQHCVIISRTGYEGKIEVLKHDISKYNYLKESVLEDVK